MLTDSGTDVDVKDNNGGTVLKIARVHNHPNILEILKQTRAKESFWLQLYDKFFN